LILIEHELAYFAGFFDGEGCVGIKKPSNRRNCHAPYISVSQVRPEVLLKLKAAFGGNVRFASKCGKNGIWCWQVVGMKRVLEFLRLIEPYLIVKKAEAQVVVEAFKSRVHAKKLGTPPEITNIRESARLRVMGMR